MPSEIELPSIVVIGAQSSGKTSVLESIIGKEFLPRGSGIVTRRPLHITLKFTPTATKEYAEFIDRPNERFEDFSRVKEEILRQTEKQCGNNKNIGGNPIRMTISSREVVDLTLVDLPGLTQNPVGDQPENIKEILEQITLQHISQESTLIACIIPANDDLANCEALRLAEQVDPGRRRTIGILTKVDIMDKGTNVLPIVHN